MGQKLGSLKSPVARNCGPYNKIIDQIYSSCFGCWRHEFPRAAWAFALLPRLPGCLELLGLAELLLDAVIAVGYLVD